MSPLAVEHSRDRGSGMATGAPHTQIDVQPRPGSPSLWGQPANRGESVGLTRLLALEDGWAARAELGAGGRPSLKTPHI